MTFNFINCLHGGEYDTAFSLLNEKLFSGALNNPVFRFSSKTTEYGIFKPNRITDGSKRLIHVIEFHPDFEKLLPKFKLAHIATQMIHQWCYETSEFLKPTKNYCSKAFCEKSAEIGLITFPNESSKDKNQKYRSLRFEIDPNGKFAKICTSEKIEDMFTILPNIKTDDDEDFQEEKKRKKRFIYCCPKCFDSWIHIGGKPSCLPMCMRCCQIYVEKPDEDN